MNNTPCIDTGLDLAAFVATLPPAYSWLTDYLNHDLDYESRPVGAYDMGCYEDGE